LHDKMSSGTPAQSVVAGGSSGLSVYPNDPHNASGLAHLEHLKTLRLLQVSQGRAHGFNETGSMIIPLPEKVLEAVKGGVACGC